MRSVLMMVLSALAFVALSEWRHVAFAQQAADPALTSPYAPRRVAPPLPPRRAPEPAPRVEPTPMPTPVPMTLPTLTRSAEPVRLGVTGRTARRLNATGTSKRKARASSRSQRRARAKRSDRQSDRQVETASYHYSAAPRRRVSLEQLSRQRFGAGAQSNRRAVEAYFYLQRMNSR